MAQQIQDLINKIKNEGINVADQQAKDIENHANQQAQELVDDARKQAEKIIADAKVDIQKKEDASRRALKQAARDTVLSLRKTIDLILQKTVAQTVSESLSSDNLIGLISEIAMKSIEADQSQDKVIVSLGNDDYAKLKDDIIAKLQKNMKSGIEVTTSDDIGKGFSISFDAGKSCFEFTDVSLAEYLGNFLNEEVASIVKEAT